MKGRRRQTTKHGRRHKAGTTPRQHDAYDDDDDVIEESVTSSWWREQTIVATVGLVLVVVLSTLLVFYRNTTPATNTRDDRHSGKALTEQVKALTKLGTIRGRAVMTSEGIPVEEFLGIPFAEKPTGELRYQDPRPLERLPTDPYEATSFQNSCLQFLSTEDADLPAVDQWNAKNPLSEDCLYLNIWGPDRRRRGQQRLAVMVWIYGGGFASGSNALELYDGKELAAHGDVLVVSPNYRLGTFGFLSTGDGRIKGNFGLKDQAFALRWIHDNIASFGGDPDQVTIFGESAGASSAGLLMLSDWSKDLFQRAIFQSGSADSNWAYMTESQSRERSAKFFEAVGCQQDLDTDSLLACLRSLDAQTILNNEWVTEEFLVFPWVPTVDGDFLTDLPNRLLMSPQHSSDKSTTSKAVLVGINKDEGSEFALYGLPGCSKDSESLHNMTMYHEALDIMMWDLSDSQRDKIRMLYTPGDPTDEALVRDHAVAVCGDRSFTCPTKELGRLYQLAGVPVYFYYLTYRASTESWPPWLGVIHAAEIQWVFGSPMDRNKGYTDEEVELSKALMTYWSNFAKSGNPNSDSLPHWPRYDHQSDSIMEFQSAPSSFRVRGDIRTPFCDKWREINNS